MFCILPFALVLRVIGKGRFLERQRLGGFESGSGLGSFLCVDGINTVEELEPCSPCSLTRFLEADGVDRSQSHPPLDAMTVKPQLPIPCAAWRDN